MLKRGYDRKLVVGSVAAGGTLGILIPPSIPMILYGTITDESVGKLFMSGVVPGALLTLAFVAYIVIASWNKPREEKASTEEKMKALRENIWGLLLPVIIIGGMRSGVFTPTEAAVVAAVVALFVSIFVYKGMKFRDLPAILLQAAKSASAIMLIVAASMVSAWLITVADIPSQVTTMMAPFMDNKLMLMVVLMILVFAVGTALDLAPTVLILTPVIMPIVKQAGIDPYYFGIMFMMNNAIGLITPPVGTVLNVVCGVARISMSNAIKGVVPFMVAQTIVMFLLVVFPEIVMAPLRWMS